MDQQPLDIQGLLIIRSFTIIFRHHNLYDPSGRVIRPSQTPLPDNTRHLHEADFHDPGEIRNRNTSKQAAANPRLKPRGHRDTRRLIRYNIYQKVAPVTYPGTFLEAESTPGHIELSDAPEKIPSDRGSIA